jgi:hypothetical protein
MFKKILSLIVSAVLFSNTNLIAQITPDGILFQAIAKDANGNGAAGRNIYAKVNLLKGSSTGTSVYAETFKVVSTDEGIFTIVIGKGTRTSGVTNLKAILWNEALYFVNIQIAIEPTVPGIGWNADNNYVDMGTSQLWTVPYALFSSKATVADSAMSISTIVPGSKGGTGVNNDGKTITLGQNLTFKGIGDITITTTGISNISLPTTGLLANTQYVSDRIGTDTVSLSNRINAINLSTINSSALKLNIDDTAAMLGTYLRQIDTLSLSARINVNKQSIIDSAIALNARKVNVADTALMLSNRFARDTASLSSRINLKVNIADTALMLSNRFARDTASLSSRIDRNALTMIDSARVMNLRKVNYTDTALMLSPYANRSNTVASIDAEKARALAAENLKLNIADTLSMLSNFYNKTATDARLNLKLNNTDTVTMLSPYAIRSNTEASINAEKARAIAAEELKVNIADTVTMLSPYAIRSNTETSINRKLNIADTALMLSPYAIRSNTEASIDAEKLRAIAAENLKVKYADTASILSPYAIRSNTIASINAEKARAIAAEDLKVNIADTSLMLSPYAIRANTEASIDAKVNIIDTAGMLSKYYNKTATDSRLEFKVNFTDTATMLTPYAIRSNTVASINAEKTRATTAENLKVNIADTTNMLSNYAIRVNTEASIDAKLNITDTTGMLSKYYNKTATDSKLELKVNFSDTSNMLSPYAIRSNTIASINAEKTRATTAENFKVNIADTSNMLAPYAIRTNTEESIITKLNIADTANMLSSYYNKTAADARLNLKMNLADTSAMLSAYAIRSNTIASINAEKSRAITAENLKVNIADTTNMLSAYAIRSNTEASINTKVNIIDTTNMLSAYAIRSNTEASINTKLNITDTASILAPYAIRSNTEASINAEKSRAMTAENLRVKYSDTTLMLSTYANLSNTEASINTKLNITDTASMLSSYYNKTAADARLNLKTNLADTSAMLSAYAIRSNTIASINAEKSRAIAAENLKLNIADTTNMLSAYAIRSNTEESINTKVNIIDTTNMLSAYAIRSNTEASINTKFNIADTASILAPYAIRSNTEASINAEKSRAMTAENLRVKYSDTTNMLSAYAIRSNTEASINTKVNIADTASMLSNYYNITAADARLNLKTNLADTATMLLPYAIRSNTVASLNLKAPLASPELTGTPKAPTATAGTNTTQIATTAFVAASITNGATPDATTTSKGKLQLTNDLGGTADLPTVTSVGGSSASSINTGVVLANAATTANTNNTIVKRNGSGDFSAGTITANLLGTSTNVTGIVAGANGGTGIDNSGKTITLGGNVNTGAGFTTTGTTGAGNAADITLKTTGATELTLPLTGTLATLTGVEALTNKTINGITPTSAANGFTLAGGTASKTLTVNNNATVSGTNTGDQTITLSGDVTGTGAGSFSTTLASSGVTAGAYGSATVVPTITVDAKGRVTNVANTTISGVSPVGSAMGSGKIIVGNALGVASIVDMSGDVIIDNLGVTTIGNNKITTDKVLNSNITYSKIQDVTTGTVLGRTSANNGIVEEIATTGTGDVVRAISPTFTGAPQVPTPLATSNNGTIANTEFVRRAISNIDANAVDGIISGAKGGTGIANTDKTITLGGNFATNGANSLMFTTTGATNVTVPTSGTLATVAQLDAIQGGTFSGGQITGIVAPANGGTGIDNTGKTITLGGSLLTGAAFTTTGTTGAGNAASITLKTTAATDLTLPTTGTLATLNGTETLTNKTITASANSISGLTNTNLSGAAGITDANLATISTAGKIANTATTATNANTINAIVSRDGSGNFVAGTITAALAGNAATATKLETQRSIYGNNFDGSANLSQVITPAYGGTGNAYTKFTGATTSEKLYNLPDANTTILTTNALITPAQGGTGVATAAMNTFFAGPISGSDAAPSFRALSASDLPAGNGSYIANSTTQQSNSNFNISGAGIAAGSLTAGSIIKKDGTSAQFLKADGTVDSRSFATLAGSETLTNKTINGVTPTAVTTGFTLAGGLTNNKTLTVAADANVSGTNTGDVALSGQDYLTISNQTITAAPVNLAGANATGILAAARFPALTGDVTNLAGAVATTISNDAITSTKIADNAVTNTKIADNAVSETKIANGAVSMSKIAPLSIQTLLGNKSNSAASAPGEITIGTGLSLNPTSGVLSASGSGGTVSNVSALTLGTTGTDVSSTVATSSTTPVITLNIPSASATARGLITTGVQTIAGVKTFNSDLIVNGVTVGAGPNSTITTNTVLGKNALANSATSDLNTAIGYNVLTVNGATAFGNTGVGTEALKSNTSGQRNTGIGESAMRSNTTGSSNTAVGEYASRDNSVGSDNTSVGNFALSTNTGSKNTAIGSGANTTSTTLENTTAIGYGSTVTASNTIQLGNTDIANVKTSGTITAGAVTYPKVDGSNGQVLVTNGSGVATFRTIDGEGASLTDGKILVGNASNVATAVNVSGDITMTNAGVASIAAGAVATADLAAAAVTYAKIQNMNSKTLIGNKSLTAGVPGEITLGSGLALNETTGVLSASGTGGTVSNVSALTFGTTGTDVSSTVTNSSSTPVITLNIPTASATNRGALSAADWTTFNNKQSSIPLKFKSGTSGGGVNIGISPTDGHDALGRAANTGYNNIAIGSNAMGSYYLAHLTGWHNVAIGTDAGGRNASGSGNLFLGSSTGMNNYDGTNNTFVGYLADVNVDNPSPLYNNATALGYNAKVTGSNKIQLGDANILNVSTSGTITAGNVTYPKVDGTNGQVLVTNGLGVATFKTIDGEGTSLTDGKILVGNASNVATAVSVSGDITMTNAGVASIAAGAVATADIAAAAVTYAKMQNMNSKTLIGNKSLTAGVPGAITLGTGLALDETTGVLSASGSGGTVSGTGAVGQLPYWSSTTGLAGNPNFTWDNTNKIAKIGEGVNHADVNTNENSALSNMPVLSVVGKINDATEQTLLRLKRVMMYGGSYAGVYDFVSTGGAGNKAKLNIRVNKAATNNDAYLNLLTLENEFGNVGINNTTPSEKLDVAGNIKFSGVLKPNNLAGSIGQVLTSQGGSSAPTWVTPSTGIGGSGTASYIPKFNASTTVLGNSLIFDDGTSVLINSNNSTVAGGSALLVSNGNNFAPVTTGTTQTGGALRIRGGDNTVIDFGTVSTKPWIQSGSSSGLQTTYPLYINPNGGTVAIGLGTASATSTSKLQVNGDVGATTFNSVGLKMNTNKSIVVGSGAPSVTGGNNISIGEGTLNTITTAGENIAIGYQSMYKTNTEENTAVGHMSMFENTGRYNTAIGFKAGYDNTSGYYNTSGDYNTFLGYKATASLGNLTNATAIGNGAVVNASNTMQLGNANVTSVKTSGALNAPVYSSSPVALTAGSTITWAPMLGLNASVTLNTNSTLSFGANAPPAGSSGTLIVTQPASGGTYTLALPSGGTHKVLGSSSGITLSTTNNAKDIVSFYYDGSIYYWNVGLGYGNAQSLSANSLTGGVAGAIPYQTATNTTGFSDAGTAGYYLTSQGTGKPTWTAPTTGIGGSGTASYIPRFNGSTTILGNSSLTDDGTGLRIGNSNGQTGIYTGLNSDNNTRLMVTGGREYESIKMSFPGDPYNNELSFNWYSTAWRLRTERSSGDITDLSFWRTAGGTTTEQMRLTAAGNLNLTGAIKTGAITYPSTAGTNGYILTTNGSNTASWTAPSFVDLSSAQTVAGIKTFSALSTVVNNNLTVNSAGTVGQGITLSDDGDFVDNNDGFGTFRFTSGIKINSNKGALGTATNITLASGGNITTNGGITASSIKLTSGASNGYILTSSADGTASWAASASSISGGTTNALPKYSTATAITSSSISDDGTTVTINNPVSFNNKTIAGGSAAVNAQTGLTYTLLQSDNGRVITMSNASAITLTIPANLTAGFNCMIVQYGAGTVTIVGSGVTVVNRSNYTKTGGQYAIVTIVSPVLNTFITGGDMQ